MKKLFYFAAAAVALAACAKNEVIPVNSGENQEITFNVAPKTKATINKFANDLSFKSYAYYLPGEETWDNHTTDPALYINGAVIANTNPNGPDGVWKAKDSYYWPKNGSLTFFAWTSLKETVGATNSYKVSYVDNVTCSKNTGIKVENYVVDSDKNKNVDFLVADIKADQKANTTTPGETGKYYKDGVPTLFRHKLSYVIFNVVTDKEYPSTKTIELKSITFKGIGYKGNYQQILASPDTKNWTVTGKKEQAYYTAPEAATGTGTTGVEITKAQKTLTSNDTQNYFLPQEFSKTASLVITYEVTTTEGKSTSVDYVEKEIVINPDKGSKMFESWLEGKKYTVTLTFKLDEILWDPAVEDWTTADGTVSSDVK